MGIHSKHVDGKTRNSIRATEEVIDLVGKEIMALIGLEIEKGVDIRQICSEAAVRLEILRSRIESMQSVDELYELVGCAGDVFIDGDLDQDFLESVCPFVVFHIVSVNKDVLSQSDVRVLVNFCLLRYGGNPIYLEEIEIALKTQISGVRLTKFLRGEEDLPESKFLYMKRWLVDFFEKRDAEESEDE